MLHAYPIDMIELEYWVDNALREVLANVDRIVKFGTYEKTIRENRYGRCGEVRLYLSFPKEYIGKRVLLYVIAVVED